MSVDEQEMHSAEIEVLEQGLRRELRHVAAPAGFADRVMARVAQREAARVTRAPNKVMFGGWHRSAGVWSAIAAALVLTVGAAVGGSLEYTRHQQKERQAAQVQAQMDLAMELTGHALDQVQGGLDKTLAGDFLNRLDK